MPGSAFVMVNRQGAARINTARHVERWLARFRTARCRQSFRSASLSTALQISQGLQGDKRWRRRLPSIRWSRIAFSNARLCPCLPTRALKFCGNILRRCAARKVVPSIAAKAGHVAVGLACGTQRAYMHSDSC